MSNFVWQPVLWGFQTHRRENTRSLPLLLSSACRGEFFTNSRVLPNSVLAVSRDKQTQKTEGTYVVSQGTKIFPDPRPLSLHWSFHLVTSLLLVRALVLW